MLYGMALVIAVSINPLILFLKPCSYNPLVEITQKIAPSMH